MKRPEESYVLSGEALNMLGFEQICSTASHGRPLHRPQSGAQQREVTGIRCGRQRRQGTDAVDPRGTAGEGLGGAASCAAAPKEENPPRTLSTTAAGVVLDPTPAIF